MGILARMQREFSETNPELMDLPNQDEDALRSDLEHLAALESHLRRQRSRGDDLPPAGRQDRSRVLLVDLASGYGDHGRNLIARAPRPPDSDVTIVAVDFQFQTLQIARAGHARRPENVLRPGRRPPAPLPQPAAPTSSFAASRCITSPKRTPSPCCRKWRGSGGIGTACVDLVRSRLAAFCIWLLTTFIIRDPMVRHDARALRPPRLHRRRNEIAGATGPAGPSLKQIKFFWFQQAVLGPACRRMRTSNVITIQAPLPRIFATASDLARWPDFLPHYRYNRFLSHDAVGRHRENVGGAHRSSHHLDLRVPDRHRKVPALLQAPQIRLQRHAGHDRGLALHRDARGRPRGNYPRFGIALAADRWLCMQSTSWVFSSFITSPPCTLAGS